MLRKTLFELVIIIAFGLTIGLIMAVAANSLRRGRARSGLQFALRLSGRTSPCSATRTRLRV